MEKAGKRDAFGIAKTTVRKITVEYPDARLYAMLCLQPAGNPEDAVWLSQLAQATEWRFRESRFNPFVLHENPQQAFPVFYARRPKRKMGIMIRNTAEDGERKLLSYSSSACCRIDQPNAKILPNQLSLFEEEPEVLLSPDDERYRNYNPQEVEYWNELAAYLERKSQPLTEFSWLLPVNYFNCAILRPLLNHLDRIPGLQYRFLSHRMIPDLGMLYELKSYEENLKEQVVPKRRYSSEEGRNSSNERSS